MDFFSSNASAIVLVLAGLCLLMIVMVQAMQVSRLRVRIDQLTGGVEGGDLEAILGEHLETVHQVGRDLDELTARMAFVESSARHHVAKEGLVRFNPFPDTGGNQSFALALLDESDDGVVISSLHSRTGTRIYAKGVTAGKADTSLSAEEQEAIDSARSKRAARPAAPARSAAAERQAPAAVPVAKAAPPAAPPVAAVPVAAPPTAKSGKAAAAPAPKTAPAPVPVPAAQTDASGDGTGKGLIAGGGKGAEDLQQKPKDLATAEADPEKVDRKPGQRPVPGKR
ncbi:MAG TPA: DUF4446 family protein [Candidatus Limnocylindrales bacterium]